MATLPDSAISLLEQCFRTGAVDDWEAFIRLTQPIIRGAVRGGIRHIKGYQQDQIEDLVQEVYLRLCSDRYGKLKKFCGQDAKALTAYLRAVAASVSIDWWRSNSAQKRGHGRPAEPLDSVEMFTPNTDSGSEAVSRRMVWVDIERCLNKTSSNISDNADRDRWIFLLYYRAGLTARAIANIEAVGLTAKGVESTILRLTRQVREYLTTNEIRRDEDSKSASETPPIQQSAKGNSV